MELLNSSCTVSQATAPRMRVIVVTLVSALHIAAFTTLWSQPPSASMAMRATEMAVTLLAAEKGSENLPSRPSVKITPLAEAPIATPKPAAEPVVATMSETQSAETQPKENAATEIKPDYQASYLNNRLNYPLSARRMGVQGRVVLNVEVLAEGVTGQINIQQSSGHEVLDQAALESVKLWRFIPARRAGLPYTRWFTVPIQFSLQDQAK